jgi:hypothetical protein
MELQHGIEIVGTDALAGSKGLREPGGLPREDLLDAEFASQDVAMHNKSAGVGGALAGAGHGKFSGVGFGEIAKNRHSIYLGFRIAAANPGTGRCWTDLFDS